MLCFRGQTEVEALFNEGRLTRVSVDEAELSIFITSSTYYFPKSLSLVLVFFFRKCDEYSFWSAVVFTFDLIDAILVLVVVS